MNFELYFLTWLFVHVPYWNLLDGFAKSKPNKNKKFPHSEGNPQLIDIQTTRRRNFFFFGQKEEEEKIELEASSSFYFVHDMKSDKQTHAVNFLYIIITNTLNFSFMYILFLARFSFMYIFIEEPYTNLLSKFKLI